MHKQEHGSFGEKHTLDSMKKKSDFVVQSDIHECLCFLPTITEKITHKKWSVKKPIFCPVCIPVFGINSVFKTLCMIKSRTT